MVTVLEIALTPSVSSVVKSMSNTKLETVQSRSFAQPADLEVISHEIVT